MTINWTLIGLTGVVYSEKNYKNIWFFSYFIYWVLGLIVFRKVRVLVFESRSQILGISFTHTFKNLKPFFNIIKLHRIQFFVHFAEKNFVTLMKSTTKIFFYYLIKRIFISTSVNKFIKNNEIIYNLYCVIVGTMLVCQIKYVSVVQSINHYKIPINL